MSDPASIRPMAVATASPNSTNWEAAYLRFETPEQEIRKFVKRLKRLGAYGWPRDSHIVELFCGRGGGLHALGRLGFTNIQGIDLSPTLIAEYSGPGEVFEGDCRNLRLADASRDILLVQGGLHHLPKLPDDLARTLSEAHRVLRPGGRFVAVEPWLTAFLRFTHAVARRPSARRMWPRLDALQTMIEHELETYEQWLSQPRIVLGCLTTYFHPEICRVGWGKLNFVGRKR